MNQSSQQSLTASSESEMATDKVIIAATQRWIERAVIGLNLCPFARVPFIQQRIRFRVSKARSTEALVTDLREELLTLQLIDAQISETTLLIHPFVLTDFFAYNDFLHVADQLLQTLHLQGQLQIASFHPDYRFADSDADAIENCSNRSPYPILHLLREASVTNAAASLTDTDSIFRRNIATLRALGTDGWRAIWRDDGTGLDD